MCGAFVPIGRLTSPPLLPSTAVPLQSSPKLLFGLEIISGKYALQLLDHIVYCHRTGEHWTLEATLVI